MFLFLNYVIRSKIYPQVIVIFNFTHTTSMCVIYIYIYVNGGTTIVYCENFDPPNFFWG